MKSAVIKRSVIINGHKTSVSLEDAFWNGLREIAQGRRVTIQQMIGMIDADRKQNNLSSAIRLFVLSVYQDQLALPRELDAGVADGTWAVAARR
jgi:predicted DNA-binding ribbon-helix-helix protein